MVAARDGVFFGGVGMAAGRFNSADVNGGAAVWQRQFFGGQ
jgi:hypothetical protein